MRTNVPEKLNKIAEEIGEKGQANLTRLTVLKKWFAEPSRRAAFALWIAQRAISRKGKTTEEAATLFREAKALCQNLDRFQPQLDRAAGELLHARLYAFQNDFRQVKWTRVRTIHNWNLLLVEKALGMLLGKGNDPAAAYKLAADYCQNYDPQYGNSLNGPSSTKVTELMRWMFTIEAWEEL